MNILLLLSHPAQFLFYKNIIIQLRSNGHKVFILIKTKDVLAKLLDEIGWSYYNILPKERGRSKYAILESLLKRDYSIFKFSRQNKIQLLLGTDASLAHVGKLLKIPCLTTLEDDYDVIKHLAMLTFPFSTNIIVPEVCRVGKWQRKKIGYAGYMKLAYLHPNRFSPDRSKLKLTKRQPYFLIRLSGLAAHHDFGVEGISYELLIKIIDKLSKYGRVCISSEKELPLRFQRYQLTIPVSDMHHYLFFAQMLICDSQSMAVEAAMLGVPSIRFSSFAGRIRVLEELEHNYQLTFGIKPSEPSKLLRKITELLIFSNLKEEFKLRRQHLLADKIDVTAFMVWFIENYPDSLEIMKINPEYQQRFK